MAEPSVFPELSGNPPLADAFERFVAGWRAGAEPSLEQAIHAAEPSFRPHLLRLLLGVEIVYRKQRGEQPRVEEYVIRMPSLEPEIRACFDHLPESVSHTFNSTVSLPRADDSGQRFPPDLAHYSLPAKVGRYEFDRLLGLGGSAAVWQAYDPTLERHVAVKLPRPDRLLADSECRHMLAEARRVSGLNLGGVVPVYDLVEDAGRCYIVSKLMSGGTLAARIREKRLTHEEACRLVASVADTLHQAHLKNVVHRDVKPGNILLDEQGDAWVCDFGLATSEAEQLHESGIVLGSYPYMSPEQARGHAHLVDGRTDIYSLGMVLYELLTGRVAFLGIDAAEIIEQILKREPRPPRTIDDTIPVELERICLKCLAKNVTNRYSTAADLAADLWSFLAPAKAERPPRRLAVWHYVAGFLVLASLTILGVALPQLPWWKSSVNGPSIDKDSPSIQPGRPESTEARIWRERLGRNPQELLWPGYRGQAGFGFRDDVRVFEVTSPYPRFAELGEIGSGKYVISLDFNQPSWTGGCGLFFGYREEDIDGAKSAIFHAIAIGPFNEKNERKFRMRRAKYKLKVNDGQLYTLMPFGKEDIPWPSSSGFTRMELQIVDGDLIMGRWGSINSSNIVGKTPRSDGMLGDLAGKWGVFHESGTTWCRDVLVKQQP